VASTAARNRRIRKARLRSQARRRLARAAHRARSGGNAGAGERAWADSATVERRVADVPVARDGHARKRECRALTSATTAVTPPGVPPALSFSGPELQLTPRIWREPAEAPAHAAENAVETKKRDATTRARKMRRGNEMCCAAEAAKRAV